jgi:arginyl-tRNA synthetase
MNQLDLDIQDAISKACQACFNISISAQQIQVQRTRKDFEGDRTVVVFPLTRMSKKSPEETAQILGEWLVNQDHRMTRFQVVKGFLNLSVSSVYWAKSLEDAIQNKFFGLAPKNSQSKVMVEFSSPNTNKPLHLGHLRNIFLGSSVSNILEAAGHQVIKVQIINNRGIHICKSMVAWKHFGDGETPSTNGLKGDKLVGKYYVAFDKAYKKQVQIDLDSGKSEEEAKESSPLLSEARNMLLKWEQGDPETMQLWTMMNQWVYDGFDTTYKEMGVAFDQLYYESDTYLLGRDVVLQGIEQKIFQQRKDGSIWVDLSDTGLDEKLLLRKDGTAVYMTQDIGTAIQRYKDFPGLDRQIYTVGNEQEYHFKVLFQILNKLGIEGADRNFHLSYGMVELPDGKMKSREGTVVDADEIMSEMAVTAGEMAEELGKTEGLTDQQKNELHKTIGYGALKYFLLKVSPTKSMMFDPKASVDFIGNTGPFIQFNYVRALSVLRKAKGSIELRVPQEETAWDSQELQIIQSALEWPGIVHSAAKSYDPSIIANYCFDLTKDFSRWYQDHPVLKESNQSKREARLAICAICERNIKTGMSLLGIQMPERM